MTAWRATRPVSAAARDVAPDGPMLLALCALHKQIYLFMRNMKTPSINAGIYSNICGARTPPSARTAGASGAGIISHRPGRQRMLSSSILSKPHIIFARRGDRAAPRRRRCGALLGPGPISIYIYFMHAPQDTPRNSVGRTTGRPATGRQNKMKNITDSVSFETVSGRERKGGRRTADHGETAAAPCPF